MTDDTTRAVPQVQKLNYNGEDIGMGFNSDTGLAVGTALDFSVPNGDLAQEVQTDVSIISSHEELISKMSLSAQLEGHYSIISAGGKTDFEKSTAYNSSSTFVMARSVITNTVTRGKDFKLKEAAKTVLDRSGEAFHTAYGDSFVRAHYNGGEFYAVMRITSVDAKTESKLAVSAHAAVQAGVGSGSFQFSLNEANSSDNTRSDFSVSFYQKGGAGENEIGATLSIDEINKRLHSFPEAVKNHAYPYFIEVANYDTIPLPVDAKLQQQAFLDALQDAERQKLIFLQSLNDCNFAAEHPEFFIDPPPATALREYAETFTQLYNGVLAHALAVARGIEAPLLFDPGKLVPPIVVPSVRLQKKDLGVLASFVDLWVNKDKPETLRDDHLLVTSIGTHFASSLLGFWNIKDPGGNADATLRLQGQALGKVLGSARDYDYVSLISTDSHLLTSLAALPQMLPANVRSLAFRFQAIEDTRGLDQFHSLSKLDMTWNSLQSIQELASLPLLTELDLTANNVSDLTPLGSCATLETLHLSGNQITDLTPLAGCKALKVLTLVGGMPANNGETRPVGNPIGNALALADIPGTANPFTLGNTLTVRVGKLSDGPTKQFTGTARRIGATHQFQAHLSCGDQQVTEVWTLQSISPLAPPFRPAGYVLDLVLKPGEAPSTGTLVNICRDAALSFDDNYCFVPPADRRTAVFDLDLYPAFKTLSVTTVDATVVN